MCGANYITIQHIEVLVRVEAEVNVEKEPLRIVQSLKRGGFDAMTINCDHQVSFISTHRLVIIPLNRWEFGSSHFNIRL